MLLWLAAQDRYSLYYTIDYTMHVYQWNPFDSNINCILLNSSDLLLKITVVIE